MQCDKNNIESLVNMVCEMIQYNNPNMSKEDVKMNAYQNINNKQQTDNKIHNKEVRTMIGGCKAT